VLERVRAILRSIGPNIYHVGAVGNGNTVKPSTHDGVRQYARHDGRHGARSEGGLDLKTL